MEIDPGRFQGLAAAKGYDQSYARVEKTRYSHEAMIDLILARPSIKQNELAAHFGYSVPWISRVYGSDAFQAALEARRREVVDPIIAHNLEEKIVGLAHQSLEVLAEKLSSTQNADLALKSFELSSKALGFGARNTGGQTVQNSFVVQLPGKAADASEWLANREVPAAPKPVVIEHSAPSPEPGSDG